MKRIDVLLLLVVIFLTFFGLLMIYNASSYVAFRDFGDKYYYIKEQSLWIGLGFLGLIFFSFFNYHKFYNLALPILIIAILLLILVFIPGVGASALGARRWIDFGAFVMQPAEFVKLSLAIYLAAWFSKKEKGRFWAFLLLLGFVVLLVMLQPDMGTAVIILSLALIVYFLEGASIFHFLLLLPFVSLLGFLFIKLEPYRAARLAAFLNPTQFLETSSYHTRQILIALGMGGLTGVGLGNSLQKYAYLPEGTTDSIFAIIAEEVGFIGALILIILFMLVVWRGFFIAIKTQDKFGKLLAGGIISFLAVQTFINLAAQTVLIPLTGVPLPFISYGGSSLIIDLCAVGILLNIAKQNQV
ncbi:MAG: putative lipid II flippase FtsW [Candidatus Levybacteria bacterium]|nr:putative lipid II flippase FtsW [Candidatus Levybacteria bacterium]MBI3092830.1 putative lipid II flippase FtsW [Candidatus Levybacteria bacterium]